MLVKLELFLLLIVCSMTQLTVKDGILYREARFPTQMSATERANIKVFKQLEFTIQLPVFVVGGCKWKFAGHQGRKLSKYLEENNEGRFISNGRGIIAEGWQAFTFQPVLRGQDKLRFIHSCDIEGSKSVEYLVSVRIVSCNNPQF